MKLFLKSILSIIIIVQLITPGTLQGAGSDNSMSLNQADPVSYLQLQGQVSFFKQALDELGATSPMQVAKLWAKSEETRNGVYQYSVSCGELKESITKKLGDAEKSFWIVGGSSPWLSKYEIVKNKKVNNTTYIITLKYYWAYSGGDLEPTFNTLTIIKNNDYWCVKEVKETQ